MRNIIAHADSQTDINLWRKAAMMCGLPIQVEIWYNIGRGMRATVTFFDGDFHSVDYWEALQRRGIRSWLKSGWPGHNFLVDWKISDIEKEYNKLFDATPKGKRLLAKQKKEAEERKRREVMEAMASPELAAKFMKVYEEHNKSFSVNLLNIPRGEISWQLPTKGG